MSLNKFSLFLLLCSFNGFAIGLDQLLGKWYQLSALPEVSLLLAYRIRIKKMCYFLAFAFKIFAMQLYFLSQHLAPCRAAGTRCDCNSNSIFSFVLCLAKLIIGTYAFLIFLPFAPNSVEPGEWEMSQDSEAQQCCLGS